MWRLRHARTVPSWLSWPHERHGSESLAELRSWLQAVDALTEAVNSTRSLPVILDLVAGSARTLLGFDFCAVLLPDEPKVNLVITGWSGLSAEYVARVQRRPARSARRPNRPLPRGRAGTVQQGVPTGRPVTVTDIATEPEFTPWGGVAREQGYASMVSVPLVAGGTVVGTLNGYHAAIHDFSPHELERLTLLANHAAIALSSARLVDQMQTLNESLLPATRSAGEIREDPPTVVGGHPGWRWDRWASHGCSLNLWAGRC